MLCLGTTREPGGNSSPNGDRFCVKFQFRQAYSVFIYFSVWHFQTRRVLEFGIKYTRITNHFKLFLMTPSGKLEGSEHSDGGPNRKTKPKTKKTNKKTPLLVCILNHLPFHTWSSHCSRLRGGHHPGHGFSCRRNLRGMPTLFSHLFLPFIPNQWPNSCWLYLLIAFLFIFSKKLLCFNWHVKIIGEELHDVNLGNDFFWILFQKHRQQKGK